MISSALRSFRHCAHRAAGFVGLVAQRNQRAHSLTHRLLGRRARAGRRGRAADRQQRQLVAHFDNQALGGLADRCRHLRQARNIAQHAVHEFVVSRAETPASATRGPTPFTLSSPRNNRRWASRENPYNRCASSRTTRWGKKSVTFSPTPAGRRTSSSAPPAHSRRRSTSTSNASGSLRSRIPLSRPIISPPP